MKKYILPALYRGQKIFKTVCAKTNKEAAEKLCISLYYIKNYVYIYDIDIPFRGIMGYSDCGMIIEKDRHLRNANRKT
jgi:hypothetical protein